MYLNSAYYLFSKDSGKSLEKENIKPISEHVPTHLKPISEDQFGFYLAGLIEGDGTFAVHDKNSTVQKYRPAIIIVFKIADLPLAEYLQNLTNCGSVYKKTNRGYVLWQIQDIVGVYSIVNIINGYMRTPKIYALHRLIDWLNLRFDFNITKKNKDISDINSNSWLAGFIDADGHFSVRITEQASPTKYPKIECKFEFSQRQKDHLGNSNELFLNIIAKFLNVSLKNFRENTSHPQYRLRTTNLESNLTLISYLNEFPLFGSKFSDYKNWEKILKLFNPRFKYSQENINNVLSLKSEMNDKRTVFIWDHLKKFYNLDF